MPKEVTPALCSLMSSYGDVSGSDSEPEGKVEATPWILPLVHAGRGCISMQYTTLFLGPLLCF